MSPTELIQRLASSGCKLRIDGEQLRVRDPEHALTNELRDAIREHKAGLMAILRKQTEVPPYIKRCDTCGGTNWGFSGKYTEIGWELWHCTTCAERNSAAVLSLTFSTEALNALEQFERGGHVFLTGRAGTGKSTLLDYFRQTTQKQIAILAPTGVAAVNVRGQTIHSFCGFGIDITPEKARRPARDPDLIQSLDAIVIDEISIVRADLLDSVDQFLRTNGPDQYSPFGGIQMIFVGDPYQLAPVVRDEESELLARTHYASPFFFDSEVLKATPYAVIQLEKVYRQDDAAFVAALDAIRAGRFRDEHLALLNSRVNTHASPDDNTVTLVTTNSMASRINDNKLRRISKATHTFEGTVAGQFNERQLPTD